jgi:hypothetical protein
MDAVEANLRADLKAKGMEIDAGKWLNYALPDARRRNGDPRAQGGLEPWLWGAVVRAPGVGTEVGENCSTQQYRWGDGARPRSAPCSLLAWRNEGRMRWQIDISSKTARRQSGCRCSTCGSAGGLRCGGRRSTRSGCPQWEVPRVGTPAPEVQRMGYTTNT